MAENIYTNIENNKIRTVLLVLLFPVILSSLIVAALFAFGLLAKENPLAQREYFSMISSLLPHIIGFFMMFGSIWLFASYFIGAKMILSSAGALEIQKQDSPEVYRLVENLAITAGLPCPKVYIIEDDSLNAFATGRKPEKAAITLTSGIIKKLNKQELEGVIAHEMSHIGNRDIRLMLLMVAGIGFCAFMGQVLLRGSFTTSRGSGKNQSGGIILILGGVFMLFGYFIAPLLRLAVSRQREYQADATASLLTRNPLALASALRKISEDARVEVLDSQTSVSAMCIANPLKKNNGLFAKLSGITKTHPPIQERISKLESMSK